GPAEVLLPCDVLVAVQVGLEEVAVSARPRRGRRRGGRGGAGRRPHGRLGVLAGGGLGAGGGEGARRRRGAADRAWRRAGRASRPAAARCWRPETAKRPWRPFVGWRVNLSAG